MSKKAKIIVVGAGPAGCAVARAYALAGCSVVLLEAEPEAKSRKRYNAIVTGKQIGRAHV